MSDINGLLAGKVGLVVGVANDQSIATGCARAFHAAGAELAVTYLNAKAKSYVEPVASAVEASIFMSLDVETDGALETVFGEIKSKSGCLDFLLHSVAYCPKQDLHGRVIDCSRDGFARAKDVSAHSFIRMAKLAEPLMASGGSLLTVSRRSLITTILWVRSRPLSKALCGILPRSSDHKTFV